jgi:aldehyde dehydrogenase (NAD+)
MIVLEDADMELAVRLGAEGSYRNSGQRCTAVKRFLVARRLAGEFAERLAAETERVFPWGDPGDEATRVGTVINEAAARQLEEYVREAVAGGAEVLCGGERRGALMMPTVLRGVARTAALMREEAFGPLSPVVAVDGLDEAVAICNESRYGLATSVMTRDLGSALAVVERVRTGMVQVNEVPAWRLEHTPFGGIKESGPGVKEGVAEAVKFYGQVKTFSLPWPGGM